MRKFWSWVKNNPNRSMFLLPIILVAGISISHVVSWYDIANPYNWAIYLSIAIEIGAITALIAVTNQIKGGIWFMFGLVTFIQMVGNIFYSFKEIDETSELFKSWVELTGPIWEMMGTDIDDTVGMKRWLAFLEGGLLPIISLTSLHFFVKYEKPKIEEEQEVKQDIISVETKEEEEERKLKEVKEKRRIRDLKNKKEMEELTKKIEESRKKSGYNIDSNNDSNIGLASPGGTTPKLGE